MALASNAANNIRIEMSCKYIELVLSQQSEKVLLQQSKKFLLETGKLSG